MKTALITFTFCAYLVCGKAAPRPLWDPFAAIGNIAKPVIEGKKAAANNIISGISKLFQGDIPTAIQHAGSAVGDVVKGDTDGLSTAAEEGLSIFGIKPTKTVSSQTENINKPPGVLGSVSSKVVGDGDNLPGGNITSTPVNNSPISNVEVQGQKPGAKIGSATSDISVGDGNMDNTNIKSSPTNNSPISDSKFRNKGGVIGSATSDIKLGKGSSQSVNIESKPVNNSPISGSSFGE